VEARDLTSRLLQKDPKQRIPFDQVLTHSAAPYDTAMQQLRIVTLGFGTARQRMALERWTNPKPQRRTCSAQYTGYGAG
jgi:hypothetical protein